MVKTNSDPIVITLTGSDIPADPSIIKACKKDLTVCSGGFVATANANEYKFTISNFLTGTTDTAELYLATSFGIIKDMVSFYMLSYETTVISGITPENMYTKTHKRYVKVTGSNFFSPNSGKSLFCYFGTTDPY